jgi:WD40 repeat protein
MKLTFVLKKHACGVTCCALKGTLIVTGDESGKVIVWDRSTFRPVREWDAHSDSILHLSLKEDCLLSQGRDGWIIGWSQKGDLLWKFQVNGLHYCAMDVMDHGLVCPSDSGEQVLYF